MAENPSWVPYDVDVTVPNAARVYDYFLDGAHNFAADRVMASKVQQVMPAVRDAARINRSFLRRAVLFMVDSGIRQFLDIGSGIPTVGNVHEIAQRADPECRIVYIDKEPIAVAHSDLLLKGNDRAVAIRADLRQSAQVLGDSRVGDLLDFGRPIGVLLVAALHFIADADDPAGIVARYLDAVMPGSY
ncbi:MAG: SAM-dependent methyltransferase, partial [Pseudonocardiaceae bacterium]